MAAEQRTETSSNANGISYSTAQIDTLLASFEAGDIITRSAVQTLLDYYADITDHNHTVVDLIRSKTFGNTGSGSETTDTVAAAALNSTPTDPGTGSTVTASKHNQIRNAVNSLRGHVHSWTDETS
jgi:hypothetical protein